MAAPMGRICSNFTQLQTRLLSFRRGIIPLKFMPRVTMAYCTHGIQSDFIYLSNTRSFTDLLRTPFPRLCDHHGNYRSIGWHQQQGRNLSSAPSLTDEAVRKEIEAITDKFMEAKEYLDDAKDSMDTVYFDEDMKDAEDAIKDTLDTYQDLLKQLTEEQKANVTRTIGLKMEELKAQLDMIKESILNE